MKKVIFTGSFKKDLKKYKRQPKLSRKIFAVVEALARGESLPEQTRPHRLVGNYRGAMECHIGNDLLLIWIDEVENLIELLRVGTHSEIF